MATGHIPQFFLDLPISNDANTNWATNIQQAHRILANAYGRAAALVQQADGDPLQIAFHIERITTEAFNVLLALRDEGQAYTEYANSSHRLPGEWLNEAAVLLRNLVTALRNALEHSQEREQRDVEYPKFVKVAPTGRPGRPRKTINLDFLREATSAGRQITLTKLARALNVHPNTLRLYMKQHGVLRNYSAISNDSLDSIVRAFKLRKPESGLRYTVGHLRNQNLRVQRRRVIASMQRVDGLGRMIRSRNMVHRRKYKVKRPNALWHVDGHHKLIRWGIVIHGIVDGFCRTITGMRASTNNYASTVLDLFLDAVKEYGCPSRVRGDRGGENIQLARFMIMQQGPDRASFIWGSSTHNTRVERMWVEVGSQFVRRWRAFFTRLEELHHLDNTNSSHIWLLHTLFLDLINKDCQEFVDEWNSHPIGGPSTNDNSPKDLRLMGQITNGVYKDDCEGVHPDTIDRYYGTRGPVKVRQSGQVGAGHPTDEDSNDSNSDRDEDHIQDIVQQIEEDQTDQIRHEGVDVAQHRSPFTADEAAAFARALKTVLDEDIVPSGYGILEEEWDEGVYPDVEVLKTRRKGGKVFVVSLAEPIWKARAKLWCQAVAILDQM